MLDAAVLMVPPGLAYEPRTVETFFAAQEIPVAYCDMCDLAAVDAAINASAAAAVFTSSPPFSGVARPGSEPMRPSAWLDKHRFKFINVNEMEFSETNYEQLLKRGYRIKDSETSRAMCC